MSKNSRHCPKCNNNSFTKSKSEPFYDIGKPKAISITYWKCQICKYEEIELKEFFEPELLSLLKGKSCFHVKNLDSKIKK